jgi:hypothetical protein
MRNENRPQLAGSWTADKILLVLGNNLARAAMSGRSCPVAEAVYARLTGALVAS